MWVLDMVARTDVDHRCSELREPHGRCLHSCSHACLRTVLVCPWRTWPFPLLMLEIIQYCDNYISHLLWNPTMAASLWICVQEVLKPMVCQAIYDESRAASFYLVISTSLDTGCGSWCFIPIHSSSGSAMVITRQVKKIRSHSIEMSNPMWVIIVSFPQAQLKRQRNGFTREEHKPVSIMFKIKT